MTRMRIILLGYGLLTAVCSHAANLPWVPRTTEHFKCVFKDGSYVEYKKIEKWFPYAEAIPHAQTTAEWRSLTYYVDRQGKRLDIPLPVQFGCEGVGKADGRLFYWDGYQNGASEFLLINPNKDLAPFKPLPYGAPPPTPGCTKDNLTPLLIEKGIADSVLCGDGWMMRPKGVDEIVAETPVWSRSGSSAHSDQGVVHHVFRTVYSSAAKGWSPVELIDNGMIYEVGKTQENQSWAPTYRCLVDRPRGGCGKR